MRTQGTLVKWNADRGFGFVRPDGNGAEVFVHVTAFPRSGRQPQVGEALSFTIATGADGRRQAQAVVFETPATRATFSAGGDGRTLLDSGARVAASSPAARPASRHAGAHRRHRHDPGAARGRIASLLSVLAIVAIGAALYGQWLAHREPVVEALAPAVITTPAAAPPRSCDGRTHCSDMRSCADATWVLRNCPGAEMDGDGDGVPCETQWCR